jgi:hypothetical protein
LLGHLRDVKKREPLAYGARQWAADPVFLEEERPASPAMGLGDGRMVKR